METLESIGFGFWQKFLDTLPKEKTGRTTNYIELKKGETKELTGQLVISGEGIDGIMGGDLFIHDATVEFKDEGCISGEISTNDVVTHCFKNTTFLGCGNKTGGCFDPGDAQLRFADCLFDGIKRSILVASRLGFSNSPSGSDNGNANIYFEDCIFRNCRNKEGELFNISNCGGNAFSSKLLFKRCTFEDCSGNDAALVRLMDYTDNNDLEVQFIDCHFIRCRRTGDAKLWYSRRKKFKGCTFEESAKEDLVSDVFAITDED